MALWHWSHHEYSKEGTAYAALYLYKDVFLVCVVSADGMKTHWPIRMPDGVVFWDSPEQVPDYAKELAVKVFDNVKATGMKASNDL